MEIARLPTERHFVRCSRIRAAGLILLLGLAGCGPEIVRSHAIEACSAVRGIFAFVPNPDYAPRTGPGPENRGPTAPPREIPPPTRVVVDRVTYIRSRAAASQDPELQRLADALQVYSTDQGRTIYTSEIETYCQRSGY